MGRRKDNGFSEEKRNIFGKLISMYDIKSAADMQQLLKELLRGTIQAMPETELDVQVGNRKESCWGIPFIRMCLTCAETSWR